MKKQLVFYPLLLCVLALFLSNSSVEGHPLGLNAAKDTVRFYVGTYTGKKSKGIYLCELNQKTGEIKNLGLAAEAKQPSFLAIHPNQKFLYAVSEISNFNGKKSGGLVAFKIDPKTHKLIKINSQVTGGGAPCHVNVDATGKFVLNANYGGGNCSVVRIKEDGSLGEITSFQQHEGSSVNPRRQKGPHAHSINLDPANKYAFVADLGLDKVLVYKFDSKTGKLEPNTFKAAKVRPGGGPRHFTFHPSGKFAYTNNEMTCSVTSFVYNAEKGELREIETISTLPHDFRGGSTAEILAHPNGKFLYCSNRGHNSIAVFSIDAKSGTLTPVEHESTQGRTPRNFALSPNGKFLLAENQGSDTIVVFSIDQKTGALTPTGYKADVPTPVCIRFLK